jgi:hypothetical protein
MKIEPVNETRSATLFLIAGAVKPFKPCTLFSKIVGLMKIAVGLPSPI